VLQAAPSTHPTGMPSDATRLETLRIDIARRLRNICEAMPQQEFDALVERIAQLEYKYEQIRELFPPPGHDV
jgi:hypothetical protein